MKMLRSILLIIAVLIFILSNAVYAQNYRIAILPFANKHHDPSLDWLTQGIPETITNDLQAWQGITLIEHLQIRFADGIRRLLPEIFFSLKMRRRYKYQQEGNNWR